MKDMLGHPRYSELTTAVIQQNEQDVASLLNQGVNPNDCPFATEPVLLTAVKTGNPNIVILLLDHQADPSLNYQNMNAYKLAIKNNFQKIVSLLPRTKPQDWLLMRLAKMGIKVPNVGVCFIISYLSILMPEDLLTNVLHELRKIPLSRMQSTFKQTKTIYKGLVQQVEVELPKDKAELIRILNEHNVNPKLIQPLNPEQLRQLAAKLIQNHLLNKLDKKTYHLLHAMWMFKTIKLLAEPDPKSAFITKAAWYQISSWMSFNQEKYIHQTLNHLIPLPLLYAGGLRCIAHYSGIYQEQELAKSFADLQTLIDKHALKYFLSLIIKGNEHTLHYKFSTHQPPTLIDINRYPVFLPNTQTSPMFCEHLNSQNNITTFSTLIYATGADEDKAKQIITSWQKSSFWHQLHELSNARMNLKTSNHESWHDTSESGGDLHTFRTLAKNNKDGQFAQHCIALVMTFALANLLLNLSQDKPTIGASLVASVLFYLAVYRGYNHLNEVRTRYIGKSIKLFNEAQKNKISQHNILKIAKNPDVFFQLPDQETLAADKLAPNFSP